MFRSTGYASTREGKGYRVVYAGALGDDGAAGAIFVVVKSSESSPSVTRVEPLAFEGPLRVTGINGTVVTLVDSAGVTKEFDTGAVIPSVG